MRLDIPVDDAHAVGVLQGFGNLHSEVEGLFPVEYTLLGHVLLQGNTLNQFHNDIIRHHRGRHIVDIHNIGMAEHSNSLAFRMEATAEILILQIVILQDLDGHQPVQPVATGLIHHGHTAGTNNLQNLISVIQQTAYVFILIHLGQLLSHKATSTLVTLSGAPRFFAISSKHSQQFSLF